MRTKEAIVTAFGELLAEKPYNKITVKDIVDRCGLNRNTFYYYFDTIPDLLEESAKSIVSQIIRDNRRFGSPVECLAPLVKYGVEHKTAILHIYRSMQRDVFLTSLNQLAMYIVNQYVDTGTEALHPAQSQIEEKNLLIRYYKCLMVGVVLDWLDAGMSYDLMAESAQVWALLTSSDGKAG
jgi:AcrR family transcriptional regulator